MTIKFLFYQIADWKHCKLRSSQTLPSRTDMSQLPVFKLLWTVILKLSFPLNELQDWHLAYWGTRYACWLLPQKYLNSLVYVFLNQLAANAFAQICFGSGFFLGVWIFDLGFVCCCFFFLLVVCWVVDSLLGFLVCGFGVFFLEDIFNVF